MSSVELDTRFRIAPNVTFRSLGDGQGAVVVETKSGQLYTCNDTTTAFLDSVDGSRSLAEIVDRLHAMFDVDRDTLETDLRSIATDLVDNGLIASVGHE
jgi:pyrroloquinoline quinone biosynthesis protein D